MNKKIDNIGRSMVEMIGVLAIVGVLSIGGIAGYVTASRNLRISNLKDEISTIVANVRSAFFAAENYGSLNNITLINAGLIPDWMIDDDRAHIHNKNKGSVLIAPADHEYKENGGFILVFNGLNATACRELAISDWGSDIATGFIALSIKNDGDLTIEDTDLTDARVSASETVILAKDISSGTLDEVYNLCNCQNTDTCAVAWKFL